MERIKLIFLFTVRYAVPWLPLPVKRLLASLSGYLELHGDKVPGVTRELCRLFDHTPLKQPVRPILFAAFRNFHMDLFEIWSFPWMRGKTVRKNVRFDGRHHLDRALAENRGVLVAVTHFGSWKMLIAALAHYGYPTAQVGVNPLDSIQKDDTRINNVIMAMEYRCEQSLPAQFIYAGGYMREVFRVLDKNNLLIMAVDAPDSRRRVRASLLDTEVWFDPAPFSLALKREIPIIPLFPVRHADGRQTLVVYSDITTGISGSFQSRLEMVKERFMACFSDQVRKHPSHYVRSLYAFRQRAHPLERVRKEGFPGTGPDSRSGLSAAGSEPGPASHSPARTPARELSV